MRAARRADSCCPGPQLARYNDPTTLPMFRRNEVLIKLESLEL